MSFSDLRSLWRRGNRQQPAVFVFLALIRGISVLHVPYRLSPFLRDWEVSYQNVCDSSFAFFNTIILITFDKSSENRLKKNKFNKIYQSAIMMSAPVNV